MHEPVVSAVMPNYNGAATVTESLDALLSQSYKSLEVIVVDDASTDNSVEVIGRIARKDSRVQVVRHQRNRGPIMAQLTGFPRATGKYIFGPSANDKVLPGFIEKIVHCMERHPQAAVGFCDVLCLDNPDHTAIAGFTTAPMYLSPPALVNLLNRRHLFVLSGTSIVRRSAYEEAGWLVPELRWMADFFALHVAAFRHGVCHVPELLYAVRKPGYSGSGPKSGAQRPAIRSLLSLLNSPEYADVLPSFNRSGILAAVPGLLPIVLRRRAHWNLLLPILLKRALWNETKNLVRPVTPAVLRRVFRRVRDRQLRAAPSSPFRPGTG